VSRPVEAAAAAADDGVGEEWDEDAAHVDEGVTLTAELRDLDAPERDALAALLHRHGDGILDRIEADWVLKVIGRADVEPHRRVFAMRAATLPLAVFEPIFLGVPLAHLGRKGARLTLEGGRFIAPFASRRSVRVNEKGTQLFLYGRDLFAQSVVAVNGKPAVGDEVLVCDEAGLYLGIGVAAFPLRGPPRGTQKDTVAVRHRLDLGLYLRDQQDVPV